MLSIKKCLEFDAPRFFFIVSQKTKTERIYPLTTEDMTAAFEKITEVSGTDLLLPIKRFIITSRWPHWCSKAIFKIIEPFLARWLVESHDRYEERSWEWRHGGAISFSFSLLRDFPRNVDEMDVKSVNRQRGRRLRVRDFLVIFAGKSDSRRHSTTGFSENVVVTGTSLVINWKKFYQLAIGEDLTSFSINNCSNISGEKKKGKWIELSGAPYSENTPGNIKLSLILVLVLKSKALDCYCKKQINNNFPWSVFLWAKKWRENVQNFAVKALVGGWWFHLSFGFLSMVDKSTDHGKFLSICEVHTNPDIFKALFFFYPVSRERSFKPLLTAV